MDRLGGFRHPAKHSRTLVPFEVSLVDGIVGEIRNLIAKYRNTQGLDMKYYPEIDQITDSFGREINSRTPTGPGLCCAPSG